MANFNLYFPTAVKWEGSVYENVEHDSGGCTKYGIILQDLIDFHKNKALTCDNVKNLSEENAKVVLKHLYWDYFKSDEIINQSLAELIVDSAFNMGNKLIAKYLQVIVGTDPDGIIGNKTIAKLNSLDSKKVFEALKSRRISRYDAIINNNPTQEKFRKGWMNRVNSFNYKP